MAYLLKESKRVAAATLKSTFDRDPVLGSKLINELCDVIMEPTHLLPIGQGEDLGDWIKAILGGRGTFEDFCAAFRVYDNSPFCGCVWTANFVAYRCKTCATSPCMSICAACFERGNHDGHEYNIFRSEAGGACDCGDPSVMSEAGFCSQHGVNRPVPDKVPDNLFAIPKIMIERMLLLLLHTLRFLCKDSILESTFPSKVPDAVVNMIDIFIEVIKLGTPIRTFVSKLLMDEDYYLRLNRNLHYGGIVSEDMKRFHESCHIWFPEAAKRLPISELPEEIKNKERFVRQGFEYKTILQELMFWTVRYEFPETLILFLLNMLPDADCKQAFARTFARHYIYIAPSLSTALRVEELSNRIVHISVQLFSNSDLAYLLAKEEGLLEIFVISLHSMVSNKLIESQTSESDFHQCIAIPGPGLQNNSYWAIVSDLVNCLGHNDVALLFLTNDDVMRTWMRILLCYSGMDLASREFDKHVEYETREFLIAFYSEREACAAPLWVLLDVLRDASTLPVARKVINLCLETLVELLDALGVDDVRATALPFDKISFHYPVHRYFSLFVSNAISRQGLGIRDLDLTESWARKIMAHPLQILCSIQEIQCNMWVRNGSNIQTQELAYKQSFFCTFFIDADLFLLQLCSCYMSPDIFVSSVFDRCRVTNCFTVNSETNALPPGSPGFVGQPEDEKLVQMLESAFSILLSTVGISTHLGISDKRMIENEVVSVLSVQSYTHSGVSERIPQCHDMHTGEKSRFFSEPLSKVIERLAVTVEGDAMAQTKYSLKDEAWKLYDPLFIAHRAMFRKNVQQAHTNYFKHLQKTNILDSGALESSVWPPFQRIKFTDERYVSLNEILNCRTLHTTIFMILYKYMHAHTVVTEKTLVYALNLLDACLTASPPDHDKDPANEGANVRDIHDSQWKERLDMWFLSNNMAINIRQEIDNIQISPSSVETKLDQPEAMEIDDNEECSEPAHSQASDEAEQCVVIQESIITMLLKLHDKMTMQKDSFAFPGDFVPNLDPPHPAPVTGPSFIRKILLFAASKSPETENIIKQLCGNREPSTMELSSSAIIDVEKERRRKKAKEMRDKLLKDFAKKQKKFLESAEIEMNVYDKPSENSNEINIDKEDDDKLDCVICGAKEVRTIKLTGKNVIEQTRTAASQFMGLICFVQPSSLLGFRTDSDIRRSRVMTPGSVPKKFETCRSLNQLTFANLREKFPAEFGSFTTGQNADWELRPHISTCGHHIHISCYSDYIQWVQRDETGYLRFEGGLGFQCPLCRQTSSIAIPCNIGNTVGTGQWKDAEAPIVFSREQQEYEKSLMSIQKILISNVQIRRFEDSGEGIEDQPLQEVRILSKDEVKVIRICLRTRDAIVGQDKTSSSEGPQLMDFRGYFRAQIEYGLHQLGGSLVKDINPAGPSLLCRKLVIGPMFHLMCKFMRVSGRTTDNEFAHKLWIQLTSVIKLQTNAKSCPLLIKDPIALLIELCVAMYPLTLEQYQHLVQVIYNLVLIQALVQISCKFSLEERRAWMSNCSVSLGGVPFTSESLDCLLGHVISCMPKSLYDENARVDQSQSSQCFTSSTVWSPQSVQSSLEDLLLHFLRITALLQFQVFYNLRNDSTFPLAESSGNEFSHLADYLRLGYGSVLSHSSSAATSTCIISARWPCSARTLITQWCKEAESFIISEHKVAFQLLNRHRAWKQPKLVELPSDYTTLFSKFRDMPCPSCKAIPKEPAICLMCGQFVCYKGMCQRPRDVYDEETKSQHRIEAQGAAVHSRQCGNGTVALLLINSTLTTVIRGPRSCMWGTLYLDHHGEEDRGWKRGRPLTLKQERLNLLTRQWINHMFDNSSKGWSLHRNQL